MLTDTDKILKKQLPTITRLVTRLGTWPAATVNVRTSSAALGIPPGELLNLFALVGLMPIASMFPEDYEVSAILSAFTSTTVWQKYGNQTGVTRG